MCAYQSTAGTSTFKHTKYVPKKRKNEILVIVVEDHNDALYHIYRAIGGKRLPFSQGVMIHFDSHPDLVIPKNLDIERIYDKQHVLNSLSIENWIMPAIYTGHFTTIAWIKPPWSSQIKEGIHKFKIGLEKPTELIKVTCTESYFVSDLAWCAEENLRNTRDITLDVCTLGDPVEGTSGQGSEDQPMKGCALSKEVLELLEERQFVLDIDLDFYSTRNPFLSMFSEEQLGMLKKLYHYDHPTDLSNETLQEVTEKRRRQLSDLEVMFNSARCGPPQTCREEWKTTANQLISSFPKDCYPDTALLNDAGCTCDDCELPHHVSTRSHIRHLVAMTKNFLSSLPKPSIITIARSSRDDYCPPEDVEFIQDCVLQMLKELYDKLEIDMVYKNDSDYEIPFLVPA